MFVTDSIYIYGKPKPTYVFASLGGYSIFLGLFLHGLHVGFDSWAQSIRAPGTLMVGYPIGIPMSVAPEYLSDSKSRAWTHTSCTLYILFTSVFRILMK